MTTTKPAKDTTPAKAGHAKCMNCGNRFASPQESARCGSPKFCDRRRDINRAERKLHLPVTAWKSPGLMGQMRDAAAAIEAATPATPATASTGKGKTGGKAGTDQDTRRAELDARVLSILATYPAGTGKRPGQIRDDMDPAPHLAALTASLKRLLTSGQAQYAEAGGTYAVAKDAA